MAETIVPIAAGKAAALTSFLVRRGNPRPGNRHERVKAEFERKWAAAPEAIREKYASRARSGATKSEREEALRGAGINPTPSQKTEGREMKKQQATPEPITTPGSRTENARDRKDRDTVPAGGGKDARSSDERGRPLSTGFAPGSDEARAAALTENSANEGLATAGRGNDVADRAIAAAAQQAAAKTEAERTAARASEINAAKNQPRTATGTAPALGTPATATAPASPATPPPGGYRPIGSRAEDIAAAKGDPAKLPTDSRVAENLRADPNYQIKKAPPGQTTGAPMPGPKAPTERPSSTALREAPDFTPGPGKELTGMSGGRPTYSSADSLYGAAKPSIQNTIANTPATADTTKPVMVQGQSIEQRRADYQTRSNTPQSQAAASNTLRTMGIQPAPETPKAPLPRGPASQPEATGSVLNNPNNAFSDAAYQRTAAAQAQGVKNQEMLARQKDVDDPNTFFKNPGKLVPLDELVKRQKIQGITPAPPKAIPVGTARR